MHALFDSLAIKMREIPAQDASIIKIGKILQSYERLGPSLSVYYCTNIPVMLSLGLGGDRHRECFHSDTGPTPCVMQTMPRRK